MLMSLHRRYLQLMRVLMLLSVIAFALGSVAHAGHDHNKERTQHQTCDYCVGYAHLAGSATHSIDLTFTFFTDESPCLVSRVFVPVREHLVAQPRAPPVL